MELLYGKPVAEKILAEVKTRIRESGITPGLSVVLIGDDAASRLYVGLKEKAAKLVGIRFEKFLLPASVTISEIFRCIDELNGRSDIHGIIVQLPLPLGLPTDEIIAHIDPDKDTDGFHEETLQRFLQGEHAACPVFPRAVVELVRESGTSFTGEKGLVLANSELLGKVMTQAIMLEGLQSEYALSSDSKEKIISKAKKARVVVTACGIPNFITGAMLAEDAIVIDGGISTVGGKVVGDVERESVVAKAAFLSPVPGGVGPVTVATLLDRVTDAALHQARKVLQKEKQDEPKPIL